MKVSIKQLIFTLIKNHWCVSVKGVNFYGAKSEYIISGSDCGHVFLWDKDSEKIVQFFEADDGGVVGSNTVNRVMLTGN